MQIIHQLNLATASNSNVYFHMSWLIDLRPKLAFIEANIPSDNPSAQAFLLNLKQTVIRATSLEKTSEIG